MSIRALVNDILASICMKIVGTYMYLSIALYCVWIIIVSCFSQTISFLIDNVKIFNLPLHKFFAPMRGLAVYCNFYFTKRKTKNGKYWKRRRSAKPVK